MRVLLMHICASRTLAFFSNHFLSYVASSLLITLNVRSAFGSRYLISENVFIGLLLCIYNNVADIQIIIEKNHPYLFAFLINFHNFA